MVLCFPLLQSPYPFAKDTRKAFLFFKKIFYLIF